MPLLRGPCHFSCTTCCFSCHETSSGAFSVSGPLLSLAAILDLSDQILTLTKLAWALALENLAKPCSTSSIFDSFESPMMASTVRFSRQVFLLCTLLQLQSDIF
jgi:hypothetical protein